MPDAGAGHGDAVGTLAPGGGCVVAPVEDVHLDVDRPGPQGLRGRGAAAQALSLHEVLGLSAGVAVLTKHRGQVNT